MKVTKNKNQPKQQIVIRYLPSPGDPVTEGKIQEWENGEGFDIWLDGTHIELTFGELMAIMTLYSMHATQTMTGEVEQ